MADLSTFPHTRTAPAAPAPITPAPSIPAPITPAATAPAPSAEWQPRVLVVDDDPVCRVAAQTLLGKLGLTVDVAVDGRHALAMAAEWPYVGIFMDCLMPDIDGYQATREIRGRAGTRNSPLVIAVTEHSRHVSLAAGMDHHIAKPLRFDALRADCLALGLIRADEPPAPVPLPDVTPLAPRPGLSPYRSYELVVEFAERARHHLPELSRAANLGDSGALSRAAVELRQRAQVVGATLCAAVCEQIQEAVENQQLQIAAALEPTLRTALAQTVEAATEVREHAVLDTEASESLVAGPSVIRVVIADDDPLARLAIEKMVERGEGLRFVGSAGDVEEVIELAATVRPDVAVVDFFMPGGGGPEAARRIRERSPDTRIVALTATDSPDAYLAMLHAGASGLVVKGSPATRLVQTIQRAAERHAA